MVEVLIQNTQFKTKTRQAQKDEKLVFQKK